MPLSQLDLKILHLIELRPTISVQELAKMTGVSWITANRHIKKLREDRVLSDPVAVFNPDRLGLERHVVFLEATGESGLQALEIACDVHPYTHYRSRVYGPYPGLFVQFDIPPVGATLLQEFLDELAGMGHGQVRVSRRSSGFRASTIPSLTLFDPKTMTWHYDWTKWTEQIGRLSPRLERPGVSRGADQRLNLTEADLGILRELTSNANLNQAILQKMFSLSQSTVSRKVISIRERFIESVRAQIDRSRFDITSTKMFYSENVDDATRARLFNAFSLDTAPPFPMSIDLLDDGGVLLWGRMPPSHEHNLFYALWRYLHNLQVFTMDTVRDHSRLYWFYPANYDVESQQWRCDRTWMVEQPLDDLRKALK